MNKSELVKALADQANISLDEATLVVNTFVDSMKDSLLEGGQRPSQCSVGQRCPALKAAVWRSAGSAVLR